MERYRIDHKTIFLCKNPENYKKTYIRLILKEAIIETKIDVINGLMYEECK